MERTTPSTFSASFTPVVSNGYNTFVSPNTAGIEEGKKEMNSIGPLRPPFHHQPSPIPLSPDLFYNSKTSSTQCTYP